MIDGTHPTRPRLVLRPDHGVGVGAGHLARSLALGQAWGDLGGDVVIVSDGGLPTSWHERYDAEGVDVRRSDGWVDGDAYVLDGYRFGPSEQRSVPSGAPLLVIDDLGNTEIAQADLIVDQNLSASKRVEWPSSALALLGPRYALLRRDIAAAAGRTAGPARGLRCVVLNAGGSPPAAWLDLLDRSVAGLVPAGTEVVRLDGRLDMAALLPDVDVAVTAAGSTVWEFLAFGIACVVIAFADNQRGVARALGAARFALDAGDHGSLAEAALRADVQRIFGDDELRASMAERGRRLVDGKGAARVARELAALVPAVPT